MDADKKEFEEKLWSLWLIERKDMDEKTYISFEDYKEKSMTTTKIKTENEKQINIEKLIAECEKIRKEDTLNANNAKGDDK